MADRAREPVYDSALLVPLRPVQAHPMDFFGRYSGNGRLIRQATRADIPRKENVSGGTAPLRGESCIFQRSTEQIESGGKPRICKTRRDAQRRKPRRRAELAVRAPLGIPDLGCPTAYRGVGQGVEG